MSQEPTWLTKKQIIEIHDWVIDRHGGLPGVKDDGLLESALARAPNAFAYGETDVHRLAAEYGFGLARNHPFNDGNKRIAFLAVLRFLDRHGERIRPRHAQAIEVFQRLGAGEIGRDELVSWIVENVVPRRIGG